jgi:hypothetical protein
VRVESFAIRLRPRGNMEAADLGVRLCQSVSRSVFTCYLAVAVPVFALSLATFEIAAWIPTLALWWAKPWLDRTILFVLARAAFAQPTTLRDLWHARRQVWWSQLLRTWTLRRLSPWRSFTQPVYQLEGHDLSGLGKRVRQIRARKSGAAMLMTSAFSFAELALLFGLISLANWFAPTGQDPDLIELMMGENGVWMQVWIAFAYALVIAFLEPFYVGAGFALYLNRRVELEAWDIEQEFRRAFAA